MSKVYKMKGKPKPATTTFPVPVDLYPFPNGIILADAIAPAIAGPIPFSFEVVAWFEVYARDAHIERLDAELKAKAEALAAASFPVPGLSFDESGVLFQGVPFSQASDAEKIRVSVSMGLAMNPKLKVILIRDGSLLDEDSLAIIAKMAAENDAQVWIERVGRGDECSVVIEDGQIVEDRSATTATAAA